MAVLIDISEEDDPAELPLKLSLRWQRIWADGHGDVESLVEIGFFLGDQPLFSEQAYQRPRGYDEKWLRQGCHAGEDFNCSLLGDLWTVLTTGERMDFEDSCDPTFRLVIAPHLFLPEAPKSRDPNDFDVLAIVQHGGPWHGGAMGMSGPAVFMGATHASLRKLFYDLLDEALVPDVSDDQSREYLRIEFAEAIATRKSPRA